MIELIFNLPEQLAAGQAIGTVGALFPRTVIDNVVVAGMGGSAIGAELVRILLEAEGEKRITVVRDYSFAGEVTARTLVLAISYSGNTEETLTIYQAARKQKAKIISITSGGRLAEISRRDGVPLVTIPEGMPPRCAIGLICGSLLMLFHRLGLCRSFESDIKETARLIEHNLPGWQRWARRITQRMTNRFIIVYSTCRLLDVAAYRWQCQLNENSKLLAHWGILPEQSHNELMGYGAPDFLNRQMVLIALTDRSTHPRTIIRLEEMLRLVNQTLADRLILSARGRSLMARLFSHIVRGDLFSVELARHRGVDPMVIPKIDRLKEVLVSRKGRG